MSASMEMPRYVCHKKVHALQILEVKDDSLVVEAPFAPIKVSWDWLEHHCPAAGGYYVVYQDGYTSYSPKTAFEQGYTKE